jgi:hypothetical protein
MENLLIVILPHIYCKVVLNIYLHYASVHSQHVDSTLLLLMLISDKKAIKLFINIT